MRKSCSACISRRTVLRGGAAGALLAALPTGCMQGSSSPPHGPIPAGNVADTTVGALQLVSGADSVILGRDELGLYAMTRVCTHLGQLVTIVSIGGTPALHCYGHGSDFTMNGAVVHGPASSSLEHFKVDLDTADGSITIQGGMPVSANERTKVA